MMKTTLACIPLCLGLGFGIGQLPSSATDAACTPSEECDVRIECVDDDTCLVICEGPDGTECEIEVDCEEACSTPCSLSKAEVSCSK